MGELKVDFINRNGLLNNGSAPTCPNCNHRNAMLFENVHNYKTNDAVYKCRDCGFLKVYRHRQEGN